MAKYESTVLFVLGALKHCYVCHEISSSAAWPSEGKLSVPLRELMFSTFPDSNPGRGLKIWRDAKVREVYRKQKKSRRGEASELGGRRAVL